MIRKHSVSLHAGVIFSLILHSIALGGTIALSRSVPTALVGPLVMVVDLVSLPGDPATIPGKEMAVPIQAPAIQDQRPVSEPIDQAPPVPPAVVPERQEPKRDTSADPKMEKSEPVWVIPEENSLPLTINLRIINGTATLNKPPSPLSDPVTSRSIPGVLGDRAGKSPCTRAPCGLSVEDFRKEIRDRLERAKRYPWLARIRGQEGTVRLRFMIKPSGEPIDIQLVGSSGWEILDHEAMELVKRVGQFPSLPVMGKEGIRIQVPLVFQLEGP